MNMKININNTVINNKYPKIVNIIRNMFSDCSRNHKCGVTGLSVDKNIDGKIVMRNNKKNNK